MVVVSVVFSVFEKRVIVSVVEGTVADPVVVSVLIWVV